MAKFREMSAKEARKMAEKAARKEQIKAARRGRAPAPAYVEHRTGLLSRLLGR